MTYNIILYECIIATAGTYHDAIDYIDAYLTGEAWRAAKIEPKQTLDVVVVREALALLHDVPGPPCTDAEFEKAEQIQAEAARLWVEERPRHE